MTTNFKDPSLKKISDHLKPVDWSQYLKKNPRDKTTSAELTVAIIDQILSLSKSLKHELCHHNDVFYAYNGNYWVTIDQNELMEFLSGCTVKMGITGNEYRYHKFRGDLVKQFKSVAIAPGTNTQSGKGSINLKNGTLDFTSSGAKLRPWGPQDFFTYQLPYEYNKEAEAPMFMRFLNDVLPDKGLQDVLSEFIGYVFVPNTILKLEKVLMLVGEGANGKSVIYDIVSHLIGLPNICEYSLNHLTQEKGEYRAKLEGKLLNYSSEISSKMETSLFKKLVSGEPVEVRPLYKDPYIMLDYAKLMFNTNKLPSNPEDNHAFFRRLLLIPFEVTIPEAKQDKHLAQKIIQRELPGILNWVLEGRERLISNKRFTQSDASDKFMNEYQADTDSVFGFLTFEKYELGSSYTTQASALYKEYLAYCHENMETPVGRNNFNKRLHSLGYKISKQRNVRQVSFAKAQTGIHTTVPLGLN